MGGDSCIYAQQSEEKDEVENGEIAYAQQSEKKAEDENYEHGVFGKQRSIVTNMDQVGNFSVGTLQLDCGCIGRNIGQEL